MDGVTKRFMEKFIGRTDLPKWFPVRGTFLGPTKTLKATDPKSGATLKGRLDALVRTADGKYHIVDYKTAYPREEAPDYHQLQLDGYAFLLERNGYKPVAGGVLLHFMPEHGDLTDGRFPFEITPVRVAVNPARIPRILFRARRILEMESPPHPSEDCEWCKWRREVKEILSR
jgi:predicted RecB family nuclease